MDRILIMISFAIILTLVTLAIKLTYDYQLWLNRKPVNHSKEWKLLALASIPSIILFTMGSQGSIWVAIPSSALMISFFIWIFFDGIYNRIRGYKWLFTGGGEEGAAKTDTFLKKIKPWQHVTLKILGFLISTLAYILL